MSGSETQQQGVDDGIRGTVGNGNSTETGNGINRTEGIGGNDDGGRVATQVVLGENEVEQQLDMGDGAVEQAVNMETDGEVNNATNRSNGRTDKCNCRKRDQCPLANQCLLENVIYRGNVQTEGKKYKYIEACSTTFNGFFEIRNY